jgi:hypothetical protein
MQIIMLSGKARVGKTWLAKEIADYSFEQGQIPVLLSLADGIKDEAQKLGLTKEEQPKEYRKFCQTFGIEKRNQDRDYWVKVLKDKINHYRALEVKAMEENNIHWERVVIVDDIRFMNEVALGRELGATQIFISSGRRTLIDSDAEWRNHESEMLANNVEADEKNYDEVFEYFLVNEGTEKDLLDSLGKWMSVWCGIRNPKEGTDGIVKDECDCTICTARRENLAASKADIIDDFLRILIEKMEDKDEDPPPKGHA